MKNLLKLSLACLCLMTLAACSRVGNGEVGVRYHTMGGSRGVEPVPLGMGWYLTLLGTNIETFPTFTQTRTWTEGNNELFKFNDRDGLPVTAEMGITYSVDPQKAPALYQRYRLGIDEITDTFVHNIVRDTLIREASQMPISEINGPSRSKLLTAIQQDVIERVQSQGLNVQSVYWIGQLGVPDSVRASINSKINATQKAQQIENEVAQARAQAQKNVAEAEGFSAAILAKANGQAKANKELADSLTPALVEYMKIQKWDGHLPRVSGANTLISLGDVTK